MKVTYISKWPPIQGGTCSQSYWTANALAKNGVKVHVVTNAWEVESNYRTKIEFNDLGKYYPKNMKLFSTHGFEDIWHIPDSNPYVAKVASLAMEVTEAYDTDLIFGWYMLPYVIAGHITKTMENRPLIARHAGSDMKRLIESVFLRKLFAEVLKKTDKIITLESMYPVFERLGVKPDQLTTVSPMNLDTDVFTPRGNKLDLSPYGEKFLGKPVLLYMGKIEHNKGIFNLIDALGRVNEDFTLLIVTGRGGRSKVIDRLRYNGIEDKTIILDFVAPWKVPEIIRAADYVVCGEFDYSVPQHHTRIPREAAACGTPTIISDYLHKKGLYDEWRDGEETIVFSPGDISGFAETLRHAIRDIDELAHLKRNVREFAVKHEEFDKYIKGTIKIYKEVIKNG
jgi:glycosyltransferase involved in cell wall biosynthesis